MHQQRNAVLFDLGGTHLRCGLLTGSGQVQHLEKQRLPAFGSAEIWLQVLQIMDTYHTRHAVGIDPQAPIVVSFPGPVADRRQVLNAPTVAGSAEQLPDLHGELRRRTGREVWILNDLTAAAWHCSATVSADRFMVLTVSSGIGSKVFDRRHPAGVLDDPPWAGEIGHVVVDPTATAPLCDCGAQGHLGAIASGRGVERLARRLALADPGRFADSAAARDYGATTTELSNEAHLVPAARAGDPWSRAVIRESLEYLAPVLLNVTVATGLERIVLIGGLAQALGPCYLDLLRAALLRHSRYPLLDQAINDLLVLTDAEEACLLGAGAFARQVPPA